MTDQPYTNREIDYHFENINGKLDQILAQTTKTNGRVTKCEENITRIKTASKIAYTTVSILIPIILSMSVWIFFNQIQDIRNEIGKHDFEYNNLINKLK